MNPIKPEDLLSAGFEDHYSQTVIYGLTHEQLESGTRRESFRQVPEWKSQYGFKLSIYGNDHFINGKKHFHFDNAEMGTFNKFDFKGNLLETAGKPLLSRVLKELVYFVNKDYIQKKLHERWDTMNPTLTKEM